MASDKCWDCPGRGFGGTGIAGTKGHNSDQGKKGIGKQWHVDASIAVAGKAVGQQSQADAGTNAGKLPKGKGKNGANQNWQQ